MSPWTVGRGVGPSQIDQLHPHLHSSESATVRHGYVGFEASVLWLLFLSILVT